MTIKIILLLLGALFIMFIVANGTFLKSKYNLKKDQYDSELHSMTETQFQLIQAGISAASSHNMQPWKVSIENENQFTLYADMNKDLPVIDKDHRQLLISQGTFIQKAKQAAQTAGLSMDVTIHSVDFEDLLPQIATFTIWEENSIEVDSVAASSYVGEAKGASNIESELEAAFMSIPLEYQYVTGDELPNIKAMLREGNRIESENQEAMEELLENFRFSKWSKNSYRYGLSINTTSPLIQTFINPILNVTSSEESFGKSSIQVFVKRLENEIGYILLKKENPTEEDFITAGEVLISLSNNLDGYIIRPAVQLLQEIDGMESSSQEFQNEYGQDSEVILIIGITKQSGGYFESVRHQVRDLILPTVHQ